jgi:acetolactate synthase-1/3 small subunit
VSTENYTIEVTGNEEKLKAIQVLLKPIGIMEIARTGNIALLRESK